MLELATIRELRAQLASSRAAGQRIALVPTMGALHAGHLALVDAARAQADLVVMSVFVNPLQFGPGEDFERYPRDLARDRELAASRGVGILFAPARSEIYPSEPSVRISAGETATRWEGAVRPGHFEGVLTVVAKLLNIVQPDVACFGQKDIQQVTLIRQMICDLDMPVELLVVPTLREADGLALSSRNAYLQGDERAHALALSRALRAIQEQWRDGETGSEALVSLGSSVLAATPGVSVDYLAIVEPSALRPVAMVSERCIVVVAARVGKTRLIDNIILAAPA